MEPGIYVTFFSEGEPFDRELPPVGPLVNVVARRKNLVAERTSVQQPESSTITIDRWLEAELEYQRATGEEPGGTRRANMRLAAPEGVFLRFASFGDEREASPLPEIGPFAVVFVGRRSIEADGRVLATRQASDLASWDLTSAAGDDYAGSHKPDIAFRTVGIPYHLSIGAGPQRARPQAASPVAPPPVYVPPPPPEPKIYTPPSSRRDEPAFAPPPPVEPPYEPPPTPRASPVYTPPPRSVPPPPVVPEPPALTEADLELIKRVERERAEDVMRTRLQEEERRRLGVDDRASEEGASTWSMRYRQEASADEAGVQAARSGFALGALLWRFRFAFIGVLVLGVGLYGITVARTGFAPGAQSQLKVVGVAERISAPGWDYVVNSVQRLPTIGKAKARGVFVVVRIGLTNRGSDPAQISPSDFALFDGAGTQYSPESTQSDVYSSPQNQTSLSWPQVFSPGRAVTVPVVFDISSGARGLQLAILSLPKTRVTID